jgi:hypothetical protein
VRLRESCSSWEAIPPVRPDGKRRLVPCSWWPAVDGAGVGGEGPCGGPSLGVLNVRAFTPIFARCASR